MHPILFRKLSEIVDARHEIRLRRANVRLLIIAALLLAVAMLLPAMQRHFYAVVLSAAAFLVVGGVCVRLFVRRERFDPLRLAREVEARDPELSAVLLTAVEQVPASTGLGYMQKRVVEDAALVAARHLWSDELTDQDRQRASAWRAVALVLLAASYGGFVWQHLNLRKKALPPAVVKAETPKKPLVPGTDFQVEITPGDTEVESGSRLVVEAKFSRDVPPDAVLVVTDAKGAERLRLPMKPTVDPKVFGGLVSNVKDDGLYRVEFEQQKSKDFKITTFVHPELVKADATVTPPSYTGQPVKEIKNTLKVTAIEGSQVAFKMKINKPVKEAELFADKDHIITLKASKDDATVLETAWVPDETRKYRLHLVDDHDRSNKQPPWFNITVVKNSLPKIEIAFPKRDTKVSRLQEVALEAKLWDDVGVNKAGAVIDLPGAPREIDLPLGKAAPGKKIDVKTLLNLEPEQVEPTQLVSYYFWAEDKGPQGETRRTMSDMFFAEIREFEDIYREMEAPPSEGGDEPKQGQTDQLAKLQKDIVNANWRLTREESSGKPISALKADVDTVLVSQAIAEEKVDAALEKIKDPKIVVPLQEAKKQMKEAQKWLSAASEKADARGLKEAMSSEQRALRYLYQAQNNEHNVTRSQSKSKSQGEPQDQQELSELELKQKEKRYEEEKAAGEEKTAEQQENLVVLNRLKELARRQEALAEKMKQLEQQMAQTQSEDEKEELANQLKRLQDEQENLLRDLDDLKERMEKPENAASMAEAKKQLEETREKVNEAAEKLREEKLAQASSAASRAQKELEKARDDFRQRTARRFGEEMKAVREQARELAQAQKKLEEAMENQAPAGDPQDAFDTTAALKQKLSGAQTSRQIDEQKERAARLMEDVKRISEQAEGSEPLLHKHLYDALRTAHTLGLEENLREASAQARYGDRNSAQDAERRASKAVEQLKEGVEKAAESVLGNESESLRMARNELDKLIEQARESGAALDGKSAAGETKHGGEKDSAKGALPGDKPGATEGLADKDGAGKDGEAREGGKGEQQGGQAKEGEKPGKRAMASGQGKEGDAKQPGDQGEEKGQKPGETGEQGKGQMAGGKGEGEGKQPGESPSKSEQPGQGGQEPGKGEGKGQMASASGEGQGQGKGEGESNQPGDQPSSRPGTGKGQQTAANKGPARGQRGGKGGDQQQGGGANGGGGGGDWFFDEAAEVVDTSAITGAGFGPWSDRLRNVSEMLTQPELRNQVEQVIDHARNLRRDYYRDTDVPQVEHLQARIVAPLVELRDKVTEELARREGKNPLAPVDRDPVPEMYRELVQKYYEQLGAGK